MRGALWLAFLGALTLSGCATANLSLDLELKGEVRLASRSSPLEPGLYTGSERRRMSVEHGRELRPISRATVQAILQFEGATQTNVYELAEAKLHAFLRGRGLPALEGVKLVVIVPGQGTVERWFPAEAGRELGVDFLAVLKEP